MRPVNNMTCDTVSIDTMDAKNPFIMYDYKTDRYYMTCDGGFLWVSKDMHLWRGPFDVLCYDTASWVGSSPVITSPEIHCYKGKYYYMATFENESDSAPRCSCTTLVADSIAGPYRTIDAKSMLLDENEMAAYPTFCIDDFGAGYMIYNHQGEQNGDGTVQIIRYTDDLGRRMGEAFVMFTASMVPWSWVEENGKKVYSPIIESPYLFYSGREGIGILFTALAGDKKAIGVAYSETGTLNGPWIVEEKPLLEDVHSATMFNDYDGTLVMVVSKDTLVGGVERSVPQLIKCDSQFEKLQIKGHYKF